MRNNYECTGKVVSDACVNNFYRFTAWKIIFNEYGMQPHEIFELSTSGTKQCLLLHRKLWQIGISCKDYKTIINFFHVIYWVKQNVGVYPTNHLKFAINCSMRICGLKSLNYLWIFKNFKSFYYFTTRTKFNIVIFVLVNHNISCHKHTQNLPKWNPERTTK